MPDDSNNGDTPETFAQTAPTMPWEILLLSANWFFQKIPGGIILKFAPSLATPQGAQIMPPGFSIQFSDEAWERFKHDAVERDGSTSPVQVARPGSIPLR